MRQILLKFITFYQKNFFLWMKPFLGLIFSADCRFIPSCSEYAREAVERYGAWKGSWLALKRIGRCHPLGGKKVDLVPENYF